MLPACSWVCHRSDKRRKDTKTSKFAQEKTYQRASSTINSWLVANKLQFPFAHLLSCEIAHVTADAANLLFTCNRPCTDRKCHAAILWNLVLPSYPILGSVLEKEQKSYFEKQQIFCTTLYKNPLQLSSCDGFLTNLFLYFLFWPILSHRHTLYFLPAFLFIAVRTSSSCMLVCLFCSEDFGLSAHLGLLSWFPDWPEACTTRLLPRSGRNACQAVGRIQL